MKTVNRNALAGASVVLASTAALPLPVQAAVDYTSITSAFSAAEIVTGLLAIGAVLASIYVAWKGIMMVIRMMKGG